MKLQQLQSLNLPAGRTGLTAENTVKKQNVHCSGLQVTQSFNGNDVSLFMVLFLPPFPYKRLNSKNLPLHGLPTYFLEHYFR